jgi:pimeloyl-ACP methyl ester carboxylesterase
MPEINTGEVKLYYEEYGAGVPIVFLHGFTLDRRMWRTQIEYFSTKYRVIVYDSRGHGKSSCPETGYSRMDRVRDLSKLSESLELDSYHLVGLSMGGATALGYAIDFPETLLSLTLVDTAAGGYKPPAQYKDLRGIARSKGVKEARRLWIRSTLFYFAHRNENLGRELADIISGHCGQLWLDPKRGKYKDRDDVSLAGNIRIPTMIFAGEKDRYFLPLAEALHEKIKNSEIEITPDVGHMLNMEVPARFNSRLAEFLEKVSNG